MNKNREAGKGDSRRSTNQDAYSAGWDKIFLKQPKQYYCSECGKTVLLDELCKGVDGENCGLGLD